MITGNKYDLLLLKHFALYARFIDIFFFDTNSEALYAD
jgi:hypothetical protein